MENDRNILVVGTGLVGLVATLALARAGHDVTLVGSPVSAADRRTSAVMAPGLALLGRLGVLDRVEAEGAALETLRIIDATGRLIRSPTATFHASEIGLERFGVNIPNARLAAILAEAIGGSAAVRWIESTVESWSLDADLVRASLANGKAVEAALVVAADGRNSPARAAAGIRSSERSYPQSAMVLNFAHSRPHDQTSNEFHTSTGPFTQVPLPGNRSSLVWVVDPEKAESLAQLDDAETSLLVEEAMQSLLGRVTVEPGRQLFPLCSAIAHGFGKNRVALVGEAAHVTPPIGAQGLNLGLGDVEQLVDEVGRHPEDPGNQAILNAYSLKRRTVVAPRLTGIDLLNRSLLTDLLSAQVARGLGLGLLKTIAPLRAFAMREGLLAGSGFSGIAADLRKQVRR